MSDKLTLSPMYHNAVIKVSLKSAKTPCLEQKNYLRSLKRNLLIGVVLTQ